jgi:hypothetical protein
MVLAACGAAGPAVDGGASTPRPEAGDAGPGADAGTPADAGSSTDAGQPDGGSSRLAWFSDWRTALGASQAARYDGTRWNGQLCSAPVLEVVPTGSLGFPTPNALRARYRRPGECQMVQVTNRWAAPPVGGALFVRFYVRNDLPDGSPVGNPHPLHLGRAGTPGAPYALWFNFGSPSGGRARMVLQLGGGPPYPDRFWSFPFEASRAYRVEVRVRRISATTATPDLRVYDATGALVGQSADWDNAEQGPSRRTLTQSAPIFPVTDESFTLLEVGNNDPGGLLETPTDRFVSFAAVAVVVSTDPEAWPGPWPQGDEARP